MVFYVVFFFVINGEPVTMKDTTKTFSSTQECLSYANKQLTEIDKILISQPESYANAVCMSRDFSKIGNL